MTDESAPCGCRRIVTGTGPTQVVCCPDHHAGCPGPWSPSVIVPREDDDYCDEPLDDDDCEREEDEWESALRECGKVPAAGGGCLNAGTEYCDFDCPFRDEDGDEE